jgi:hypothetical protein
MSKGIRRPHLKHPFEAKNVIVAGCAAIAMVLGAMSVGTSFTSPNEHQATRAEVSSIVDPRPSTTSSSAVSSTGLSRQHTLEVRNFLQQQNSPLYTSPPPGKASRNSLAPVFGVSHPVRLIDQMVQLQQPAAQPTSEPGKDSSTARDSAASEDPTAADTAPAGTATPTDGPATPGENPTPPSDNPSSSGIMNVEPSATE